jgi:O-methyltransferase involved in polyketide biosynthesis
MNIEFPILHIRKIFLPLPQLKKLHFLVGQYEKHQSALAVGFEGVADLFQDPQREAATKQNFVRHSWLTEKTEMLLINQKVKQVVVLGYGMHGYAFMEDIARRYPDVQICGLELPETTRFINNAINSVENQQQKILTEPKNLTLLSCDLSREDLHYLVPKMKNINPADKTEIVSIGLNSYLSEDQNEKLFKHINQHFAKGSVSLFTVVDKFDMGDKSDAKMKAYYESKINEPLKWQGGREEIGRLLKKSGNNLASCRLMSDFIHKHLSYGNGTQPVEFQRTYLCTGVTKGKDVELPVVAESKIEDLKGHPTKTSKKKINPNQMAIHFE